MSTILFQNKKINYKVSGRGNSTVVLLHGFLEDLTMWGDLAEELSKKHKIISVDLLGHGKTENLAEIHTMELIAEVVLAVLKEENADKVKIIGHSMGGYVSLALARKNPQFVEKIILLNSIASADSSQKKEDRLRAIKALNFGKRQFINNAIPNLFAEQNRKRLDKEIEKTKETAQNTSSNGISAALLGMRERECCVDWIKTSKISTFFISGENDPIMSLQVCEKQAKKTRSKIYKIGNCGHMAHIETKEECLSYITECLKQPRVLS